MKRSQNTFKELFHVFIFSLIGGSIELGIPIEVCYSIGITIDVCIPLGITILMVIKNAEHVYFTRTRAMIILFLACCDAPLPNGISYIQMKDNSVYG